MNVPVISGVSDIAGAYDAYVLDLWGVLYDGARAFPWALETLERLREGGARIAILSNAPRRSAEVARRIEGAGIGPAHYDFLLSSGEEAWQYLSGNRRDDWYESLGQNCFFIGPETDRAMLDGLDVSVAESVGQADFLLDLGPFGQGDVIEDYQALLGEAASLGCKMVCANPDLLVHRLGRVEICAGAIAERFAALGGDVRWHGKPYASVYESCLEGLAPVDRERVLVVGDSLRTDIAGASAAGLESLLVAAGIHRDEMCGSGDVPDVSKIEEAVARTGIAPTHACGLFTW